MKIYLAGPMTGKPHLNFAAFNKAAAELREVGHEVINPAELDLAAGNDPDRTVVTAEIKAKAMSRDLPLLCTCDAIAFLPDSELSEGCFVELALARYIRIPMFKLSYDETDEMLRMTEINTRTKSEFHFTVSRLNQVINRRVSVN